MSPVGVSTGYIEFKIDGEVFMIDDFNGNAGNGLVTFSNTPSLPLYQVVLTFYTASTTGSDNITLQQISQSPLEVKDYVYSSFTVNERPMFIQILPSLYGYIFSSTSTGNINITRFDTVSGGKVEGTLSFSDLNYQDASGNLVSTNHQLTEGKFSVVVD